MPEVPAEIRGILEELRSESVSFIEADQLTDAERAVVPDWWLNAVGMDPSHGIARAIEEWNAVLPNLLPQFISWLRSSAIGVFLGRSEIDNTPLFAYACMTTTGRALCWIGFPPSSEPHNPNLNLTAVPALVRAFVTQLHDGFRLLTHGNNTFLSARKWFALGDVVGPESLEFVGDRLAPDVDQLVCFFFDFGSSSVCFELTDSHADSRAGWVAFDDQVDAVDDIWAVIDRWLLSLVGA